jgi:MYXO-CTERM domain-containing protein
MNRKRLTGAITLGLVLSVAGTAAAGATPKKGVGTWAFTGESVAMASANATWFYTWGTNPQGNTVPQTVSFVPMIWGSGNVTSTTLTQVKTEGSVLLGFNEPDMSGQSNLTPAQAIALWPQLVATGMRLGSPAVSANAQMTGGWLDTFMTSAKAMNLPVDFICLHWYGGNFDPTAAVSELQSYVEATHTKFNLPIWVTEFALTNFSGGVSYPTEAQQASFASGAVDMLEALPYVERYAWFALPPCDATGSSSCDAGNTRPLSVDGGALTEVGVAYAGAGPDGGSEPMDATTGGDGGTSTGPGSSDASVAADATTTSGSSSGGSVTSPGEDGGTTGSGSSSGSAGSGSGDAATGGSGSSGGCNCETARSARAEGIPASAMALGAIAALVVRSRRRRGTA